MKQRYTITMAIESVAEYLKQGIDHSPTTIRCVINDTLDDAEKNGYRVNHDYNQPRAVKAVRKLLGK